jgi:sporadic carbohydrate cluster protein (TIGR04323 family)
MFVPQRVQNLVIRNYAEQNNILFLLSATEYYMEHCSIILEGALQELADIDGLIFYSTHLLPSAVSRRKALYDTILSHNCELHFALESLVIKSAEDISLIEDVILCRKLAKKEVASELLGEVGIGGLGCG